MKSTIETPKMMLWYDSSSQSIFEKFKRAAEHFEKKYGKKVGSIIIGLPAFEKLAQEIGESVEVEELVINGMVIRGRVYMTRNHFLIGP